MPQKGKSKKIKEGPLKDYTLITMDELRARELKYTNRLVDLRACAHMINDAIDKIEFLNDAKRLKEKWETYLRCDGLPKPGIPPEVRLFFVKLLFFENANVERTIDWQLSVNERSILSQDIFRKDLTRKTLVNEIRPNFGIEYGKNIDLALKVLKSIEYYLDNHNLVIYVPSSILMDVIEQKKLIHDQIRGFFDRYSYRILCSEDAYMETVDARTAEYFYGSSNFSIHLWTLKNVPVLFEFFENRFLRANLHQLKIFLQMPYEVLEENLTLRGLHLNFDHFSEHAKSYEQHITTPEANLNAGIPDIHECLINEWNMQIDIQNEVRNKMIEQRQTYEEKMQAIQEEEARKAKERKNQPEKEEKKKKPPKLPKEPPIITDNLLPDIWEDFLKQEQSDYENFINILYHPDVLKLTPSEINLKKYFILGGIYQLDFVTKPTHYDFNSFNMTWHHNNAKLDIRNDVFAYFNRNTVFNASTTFHIDNTRASSRSLLRPIRSKSSKNIIDPTPEQYDETTTSLFVLTFVLPDYLCLWGGTPVACHFEADVTGYLDDQDDTQGQQTISAANDSLRDEGNTIEPSALQQQNLAASSKRSADATSLNINKLASVGSRHSTGNVYRASLTTLATLNMARSQVFSDPPIMLDNFDLTTALTKDQIRNMQRHCIPRILSSYKFPKEIKDEENEENRYKSKGKGGTLVRKHASIDMDAPRHSKLADRPYVPIFSTEQQNNPERMFPIFPKFETIHLNWYHEDDNDNANAMTAGPESQTFFKLIDTLETIGREYHQKTKKTRVLPSFKPRTAIERKARYTVSSHMSRFSTASTTSISKKKPHKSVLSTRRSKRSIISFHDKAKISGSPSKLDIGNGIQEDEEEVLIGEQQLAAEALERDSQGPREEELIHLKAYKYSHWTQQYIMHSIYEKETGKYTIWTDRLGTFGFAFKRYEHFPFRFWSVEPSEENPDSEIVFTLETQYVKCVLFVTSAGYRGYVTELTKKFVRHRAMYLVIDEPTTDFKEIKKLFREKNLNIFSEHDARFYIENGYFSEKHLAAELHTYSCMAIHGTLIKFQFSDWNRLAKRRDIILRCAHHKETDENMCTIRITPEDATFVEIKELCSDDLNEIKLEYTLTWRNIDFYADLHHIINSMCPAATDLRVRDPYLICGVRNLLREIRPLSYS